MNLKYLAIWLFLQSVVMAVLGVVTLGLPSWVLVLGIGMGLATGGLTLLASRLEEHNAARSDIEDAHVTTTPSPSIADKARREFVETTVVVGVVAAGVSLFYGLDLVGWIILVPGAIGVGLLTASARYLGLKSREDSAT